MKHSSLMKQPVPRPKQDDWNATQILQILRTRWRIIAASAVFGVMFALIFHTLCPRKYESKALLLVMRKDPRLASKGIEGVGDTEVRVTEELLATHMQMLQSRSLVEGALINYGLSELPSIVDHLTATEKPADHVISNLAVSRGGSGQARTAHVLNISLRSSSKVDSKTLLKAIIKKYQSFLSAKFQDVNEEAATLITQAQTELAADLEAAERNYERFRQDSSNLMWKSGMSGTETTNVHRVRYEGILEELASLQLNNADASARLDAINERIKGGDSSELTDLEKLSLVDEKNLTRVGLLLMAQKGETDSPDFQAEQPIRLAHAQAEFGNLAGMQMKEQAMLTELGPQHPEIIGVRKQIESFGDFLKKEQQDLASGRSNLALNPSALFDAYHQLLKNDILAMERREERLKAVAEVTKQLATDMVADEIQGETLRREVQRKQMLFDAAVDRLRDINLAKDYGGFINEVLSEPEIGLKVMPRLSMSLMMGILLSIGLSLAGVAIAEYRDRRFRTIGDLRSVLQLPVMGQIPVVATKLDGSSKFTTNSLKADATRLPKLLDPDSRGADAFRLLRTSLVFGGGDEYRQVVCVTSPIPADGKSTVTGNLAVSLGQIGRRVLVIDCDLRRPSQHQFFSLPNERGLTTILRGDLDPTDLILTTSQKNVWLLPRGEAVSNPAEFLATGEFARLLDSFREKFDQILVDCPPILPVVDALTPASIADGVIVVIRIETTTRLQAQAACSSLKQAGAEIEGIVINGLKPGSFSEDSYGYGYGYGYDESEYSTHESKQKDTLPATREPSERSRLVNSSQRNGASHGKPY